MLDVPVPPAEDVFVRTRHDQSEVTVAVTLFNYADVVLQALESLAAQELADVDLVVVDDCSEDGGTTRVRDWMALHSARFGRCRLTRHVANHGLAAARNQTFARAVTPFVFVLDADNEIYPRCLSTCRALAQERRADAVYTLIEVFGDEQGIMGNNRWEPEALQLENYIDAMALIRRSAWQRVGGYRRMPVSGWEDYDLWLKFAEAGMQVAQVPEILCRYRRHKASMLQRVTNRPESIRLLQDDLRLHHPAYVGAPAASRQEALPGEVSRAVSVLPRAPQGMRRLNDRAIPAGHGEVRAFMAVRNEALRLPFTLQHHRSIGIDRFFVVDNGSTDGTVDLLLTEPDVHVFSAETPFSHASFGMDWIHALLFEHGLDRWTLIIDADEHFVFPECESVPIREYCREVERAELDAISALVLDMYAKGPIAAAELVGHASLVHACPYFDAVGYVVTGMRGGMPAVHGGPRARLFWPEVNMVRQAEQMQDVVHRVWSENGYLAANADVNAAVQGGLFRSGLEHFERHGRFEGRELGIRPLADWDEERYLRSHPDVAEGVARGLVRSGLEHFVRFGSVEGRLLFPDESPCLSICPVVKWTADKRFVLCRHGLEHPPVNPPRDFGGVMLHFKLLADFPRRAMAEATRGEHWKGAAQYRRYAEVFRERPELDPYFEGSRRYAGSEQLVRLGYMRPGYEGEPGAAESGCPGERGRFRRIGGS